ncbi:hypothetical protein CHE218_05420 [Microbacterium sp. che218]
MPKHESIADSQLDRTEHLMLDRAVQTESADLVRVPSANAALVGKFDAVRRIHTHNHAAHAATYTEAH